MLSFRIFSSSLRGASALATNQISTAITPPNLAQQASQDVYKPKFTVRAIGTTNSSGGYLYQAARANKAQKMDTLEYDINLPEKPKKPVTPWVAFVRDRKDDVIRQKDKMTAAELSVILAKEWKYLDKTRYQEDFERRQQEYQLKIQEYKDSLTEEHRNYLDLQKEFKREDRANKQIRRTKPPVLPRNPANLYCQERSRQEDVKEQLKLRKPTEVFRDIFKQYRELPESEKKKYIDMQADDKLRFQHEFIAWYESIQNNENLTKAAREKADALRDRFKALNYI